MGSDDRAFELVTRMLDHLRPMVDALHDFVEEREGFDPVRQQWDEFLDEHPELTEPETFSDEELISALRKAIESHEERHAKQPWIRGAADSSDVVAVLAPHALVIRENRATPVVTRTGKQLARLAREGRIIRLRQKWTKGRGKSIWSLPGFAVSEYFLKQYEVEDA